MLHKQYKKKIPTNKDNLLELLKSGDRKTDLRVVFEAMQYIIQNNVLNKDFGFTKSDQSYYTKNLDFSEKKLFLKIAVKGQ